MNFTRIGAAALLAALAIAFGSATAGAQNQDQPQDQFQGQPQDQTQNETKTEFKGLFLTADFPKFTLRLGEKGRTEIDHYNGHLIRLAVKANVPCPLNWAVHDLVSRMTRDRAKPHQDWLRELTIDSYRAPKPVTSKSRRFSSTG